MLITNINRDFLVLMYKINEEYTMKDKEYKIKDVYFKILYAYDDGSYLKSTWFQHIEKCDVLSCNYWYIYIVFCIVSIIFICMNEIGKIVCVKNCFVLTNLFK